MSLPIKDEKDIKYLPLSSPGYLLSQGVSCNLHLAGWATLDNQFSLGMSCLSIPGLHTSGQVATL